MCLFFKQSKDSTGADDSNFGPKQGGGDSEKTQRKLPNKKSKTRGPEGPEALT